MYNITRFTFQILPQYIAFTAIIIYFVRKPWSKSNFEKQTKKYALYFLIQGVLIYSTEEKVRNEVTEYDVSVAAQQNSL